MADTDEWWRPEDHFSADALATLALVKAQRREDLESAVAFVQLHAALFPGSLTQVSCPSHKANLAVTKQVCPDSIYRRLVGAIKMRRQPSEIDRQELERVSGRCCRDGSVTGEHPERLVVPSLRTLELNGRWVIADNALEVMLGQVFGNLEKVDLFDCAGFGTQSWIGTTAGMSLLAGAALNQCWVISRRQWGWRGSRHARVEMYRF
ncbi:hypothetical protein BG003_006649 [Podila horticola]|nr:hypothetical protein BG003_006649 [Podila horticola]